MIKKLPVNKPISKTAIVLFSYSPNAQVVAKPLSQIKKKNDAIWNQLHQRTLGILQKTSIPFFLSNENNQVGESFGQKINNAIQHVFDKGYNKVIVIGNDCLDLSVKNLKNACTILQENNFVLGQDFNGGAYLIGVTKDKVNEHDFENLPWHSKQLFSEIYSLFTAENCTLLKRKYDFNSQSDFEKALNRLSFSSLLRKKIAALLHKQVQIQSFFETIFQLFSLTININKGPPLLLN